LVAIVVVIAIVVSIGIVGVVEVHLFLGQGDEVAVLFVEKTVIEGVSFSVSDRLLDPQWFFLSCSVVLHLHAHRLGLIFFQAELHQLEVVFAANCLTNKKTHIQGLFSKILPLSFN